MFNSFNHAEICAAIENDAYDFLHKVAAISGNQSHITEKISWVKSADSDWPNRIFRAKFTVETVKENIAAVIEQIKLNKAPTAWIVGPLSSPCDLRKQLLAQGFQKQMGQSGMAIDLSLTRIKPDEQPNKLIIHTCDDIDALREWKYVSDTSFNRTVNFDILVKMLQEKTLDIYAGSINRQVVATLIVSHSNAYAGLHTVTTHPDYRKQGIAGAMVLHALHGLQQQGCSLAALQASVLGESVYRAIGFKKYLDLDHYKWRLHSDGVLTPPE